MAKQRTGMAELRLLVRNFDDCRESFNDHYTLEQLVQIHRMWMASGWDIYPDQWDGYQVLAALDGYVPQWDPYTERPLPLVFHGPWRTEERYVEHGD